MRSSSADGLRRCSSGLLLVPLVAALGLVAASSAATPAKPLGPRRRARPRGTPTACSSSSRERLRSGGGSLRRAGATLVEHDLQIWALPPRTARRLLPALVSRGLARRIEADRSLRVLSSGAGQAVLPGSQWWLEAIHAAKLTPPGPGKPVTVVDTGVDVYHPEFAGRPEHHPAEPADGHGCPRRLPRRPP